MPRWAVLSGVAGLVANALLIGFFALNRPWQPVPAGYGWLGPANDAVVVAQFAALVPVAISVRVRLGAARLVRGATVVAVAAMCVVVGCQPAVLAGLVVFDVQVWVVIGCLVVTFGWVLVASRAGRGVLAPFAVRLGTVVGAGALAGFAVAAAGLVALPWGSVAQYAVCGVGGVVGLAGWLGFPVWPLVLARGFEEDR